jgi:hypothetical protein
VITNNKYGFVLAAVRLAQKVIHGAHGMVVRGGTMSNDQRQPLVRWWQ